MTTETPLSDYQKAYFPPVTSRTQEKVLPENRLCTLLIPPSNRQNGPIQLKSRHRNRPRRYRDCHNNTFGTFKNNRVKVPNQVKEQNMTQLLSQGMQAASAPSVIQEWRER